jgi:hypothetical protein
LYPRKVEENKRRERWKVLKVFGEKQKPQTRGCGCAGASSRRIKRREGSERERKVESEKGGKRNKN